MAWQRSALSECSSSDVCGQDHILCDSVLSVLADEVIHYIMKLHCVCILQHGVFHDSLKFCH